MRSIPKMMRKSSLSAIAANGDTVLICSNKRLEEVIQYGNT
ncbi:hypothetical protein LDDCCGHA_3038 [Methylobacterium oxalidis]|nr:hypothetical protein LDDCCGHA_3038 [Methylobacterium oxalidis]